MSQNIIEYLREQAIKGLFATSGFSGNWNTWRNEVNSLIPNKSARQIFDLGDNLSNIFKSTASGRDQSGVSIGGASWEALVCWYLNLCLIGRRTVVIKHSKKLIPAPISDAITVNYNNFTSNTESDLVAITFPDREEYTMDKLNIAVNDANNVLVPTMIKKKFNMNQILDALAHRDFSDIEIHIIQCKTNWNDNAQIPMLWDMIYSANAFRNNIKVGKNGYSIHDVNRFSYSFVTVPTVDLDKIKATSTCVKRVYNLSGGNYWGLPSQSNVASSIKELLGRNLNLGASSNHLTTLAAEIPKLSTDYSYFRV